MRGTGLVAPEDGALHFFGELAPREEPLGRRGRYAGRAVLGVRVPGRLSVLGSEVRATLPAPEPGAPAGTHREARK